MRRFTRWYALIVALILAVGGISILEWIVISTGGEQGVGASMVALVLAIYYIRNRVLDWLTPTEGKQ